ncbi:MAG: hypothetical protein JWQ98_2250 [Chlorobi bacterium]|nr:hypothetical protein [Chlorobiota bacterium]
MRVRLLFGALALSAAMLCAHSAQAQNANGPKPVVASSALSAGGLYVYPGSFPCTPGPGFCEKVIIVIILNMVCPADHDYRTSGNIQMGISENQGEGYIADVNGFPLPASATMSKGETAYPTMSYDPPPGNLH